MTTLSERLRFDAARCEMQFSKGVAGNIEEAADEIERLQADLATYVNNTETTENRIIDAEFAAQELRSEIERLRATLQEIAGNKLESRAKLEAIARRALEPKP